MILPTIRRSIKDLPFITFEQYFTKYVFDVQDTNIDSEVQFILNNNFVDYNLFNRIMNSQIKDDTHD